VSLETTQSEIARSTPYLSWQRRWLSLVIEQMLLLGESFSAGEIARIYRTIPEDRW
jgi:hypothetical protein